MDPDSFADSEDPVLDPARLHTYRQVQHPEATSVAASAFPFPARIIASVANRWIWPRTWLAAATAVARSAGRAR